MTSHGALAAAHLLALVPPRWRPETALAEPTSHATAKADMWSAWVMTELVLLLFHPPLDGVVEAKLEEEGRVPMFKHGEYNASMKSSIADRREVQVREQGKDVFRRLSSPLVNGQWWSRASPEEALPLLCKLLSELSSRYEDQSDAVRTDTRNIGGGWRAENGNRPSTELRWLPADLFPLVQTGMPVSLLFSRPFDEDDEHLLSTRRLPSETNRRSTKTENRASVLPEALLLWTRGLVASRRQTEYAGGSMEAGGRFDAACAAVVPAAQTAAPGVCIGTACEHLRLLVLMLDAVLRAAVKVVADVPSVATRVRGRGLVSYVEAALGNESIAVAELRREAEFDDLLGETTCRAIGALFGSKTSNGTPVVCILDALNGGPVVRAVPGLLMHRVSRLIDSGTLRFDLLAAESVIESINGYLAGIQYMEKPYLGLQKLSSAVQAACEGVIGSIQASL